MLVVRLLDLRPAVQIELTLGAVEVRNGGWTPRSSGLYGASRGRVVGPRITGFVAAMIASRAERGADIRGQTLEQSAGISRLWLVLFSPVQ